MGGELDSYRKSKKGIHIVVCFTVYDRKRILITEISRQHVLQYCRCIIRIFKNVHEECIVNNIERTETKNDRTIVFVLIYENGHN